MIAVIAVVAALITGGLAGSFLTMTATKAAASWWQERMQQKVRYWQAEVARSRDCHADRSHGDG